MWQETQKVLFLYFIDVFHFIYDYVLLLLQHNWKSWYLRSMLSVLCDSLTPDQTFRCNVIFEWNTKDTTKQTIDAWVV